MENTATFDNQATAGVPSPGTIRQMGEGAAEAGRQLWLAGLGLVALAGKAVRESGHAFEVLVEEGRELEPQLVSGVKQSWAGVSNTVESMGSKVTSIGRSAAGAAGAAGEGAAEGGSFIGEKVKSYIEGFGFATREDLQQIISRLESIESRLQERATAAIEPATGTEEEEPEHGGKSKRHPRH